jgi:hypothetical protein
MLMLLWLVTGGLRDRGFSPAGIAGSVVGAVIVLAVRDRVSPRRGVSGPRRPAA